MDLKKKCPVPVTTTEQSNQNKRVKGNISLILLQLSCSHQHVQLTLPFEQNYEPLIKQLPNLAELSLSGKVAKILTSKVECSGQVNQTIIHSNNSKPGTFTELPDSFIGRGECRGFKFTQIQCSNSAYLYQVQSKGTIYYEVFKRKGNLRFGNIIYPSAKAFGKWAWTTASLDRALEIYAKINRRQIKCV